ncbi:unnamed protein product [Tilletia controversa]|uniref:U3 small nucleolar RNA-associated protein 14 n=3 Tax=Tilletia TaxID=13289 RepID=A0A8X7MWV8_9BASI|nr:hypothetical protein CF336_g1791 [Tilletia laevis]KAE8203284.1 hypothetical protein CF328_g1735 [Tilletia controversa]CAD6893182.1 unnamed protein product [Tilletia caries]KAE8207416.1 hypothetical protein CF335_g1161 [Tilletia laevis]KAE8252414.1 hypothetical protein A4X06_0g2210 [Tilletia controversa]
MARGTGNVGPRGSGKRTNGGRGGSRNNSGSGSNSNSNSNSNSRDENRSQAAQRLQRKEQASASAGGGGGGGPSSVLGVYDYVVNADAAGGAGGAPGKKRKRSDRALRRATAGFEESAGAEGSALNKRRRHNDDDGSDGDGDGDGEDEDDDDDDLSDTERVRAPAIFSDDEDGDGEAKPFEGEDEDIDSDEAFGESDEERYDGWAFSGSKSKRDEDDEDEEDEDAMGLDQVLNAVSDDDDDDDEEDDDDDEAGVKGLDELIGSSSSGQHNTDATFKPANFFNFDQAQAAASASGPVTLEDLLGPLAQDASLGGAELRKRVSALASENKGKGNGKEGAGAVDSRTGALAAPLPAILQDRVDRAAAYEVTRAQVEGWQPTLKRLREAEHLSFPLQKQPETKSSNSTLVSSMLSTKQGSVLRSELESQTADLLRAAEMTDSQIVKKEDLALNKLDPALVEARRRELARMRELMFRAEQKAKRVSKIKSKSYRRIARKDKEKLKQKMAEAGLSMGNDDDDEVDYEADRVERVKAERERALERATLKHKNTGQWAKTMSGRQGNNAETIAALEEQLRRGQQLRQKVQGSDDDDDDSDDENEDDKTGANAFESDLEENEAEIEDAAASGEVSKGFGKLMQMKFMKEARAKADQGVREAADELRAQLAGLQSDDEGEDDDEDGDGEAAALRGRVAQVGGTGGRAVFSAAAGTEKSAPPKKTKTAVAAAAAAVPTQKSSSVPLLSSSSAAGQKDGENPWLNSGGTNLSAMAKRQDRNGTKSKQRALELAEDAKVDLLEDGLGGGGGGGSVSKATPSSTTKSGSKGKGKASDESGPSTSTSAAAATRGIAFTQRDLVAEAFAGDDVTAQFAEQKRALVEADAPQEEDNSLPGWGSWSGKGVKHSAAQKARLAANRAKHTRTLPGLAPSARKDAGMEHVVINERADKKVEKYKVKDLPYPFTSAAQYELVMRGAMGAEWNTRTQHQRMTLPRVVTKPGKAIAPIERKF